LRQFYELSRAGRRTPLFRRSFALNTNKILCGGASNKITMNRLSFAVVIFSFLPWVSGCSHGVVPVAGIETAPLLLPNDLGPIIVLVDHLPGKKDFVEARAEQVAIALRHFSTQTSWDYVDTAPVERVEAAAAVVYLGLNGTSPLSAECLARLCRARRLIVSGYHLAALREAGVAFQHTDGGQDVLRPPNTSLSYKGQRFSSAGHDFLVFKAKEPARVLSSYSVALPNRTTIPYIVQDGDALFVNGDLSFYSGDAETCGPMLAAADAMTHFIGAHPLPLRPQCMLRLEDVSALTPVWRLDAIVRLLAASHVPYGIAVIPELRLKGKRVPSLESNHKLVGVLRWAEAHGATVILHGLHHCCSSEGAEGYEFWDHDHNAPLQYDSAVWMRSQIIQGIAYEQNLGLHPALWETPHYSASPLDYGIVSEYFGAAWELRRPIGWLPWVLKRDQYGAMVFPEDLGYVSLDRTTTVADQLVRAKELRVCQTCLAAGFFHPSTVEIEDVREYVRGLRDLGYAFVNPRDALRQYGHLRSQ
jgi:hypothetical protein